MARASYGYEPKISLGLEVEGDLIEAIVWKIGTDCRKATREEDKNHGTDMYVYGVPCDITCDIMDKDHTVILSQRYELSFSGIKICFGVRTGNSHNGYTRFDTPVLVIGFEGLTFETMREWKERIISVFVQKLDEIIDVGQSQYWDWMDAELC